MQFQGKQPVGIVFLTAMNRPDAALAIAALYGYEGKREARLTAVGVSESGLGAAIYCDILVNFCLGRGGQGPNSNRFLPVGLVATDPLPADPAMVKVAVDKADYKRGIRRVADTSEMAAMFRNALTGVQAANSVVILSSSAAALERSLALAGTRESVAAKVRFLVVTERALTDAASLARVLAIWPTEIVYCDQAAADAVLFPATSIETDFAWAPAHPVADVYRAYQPMPYDAPALDLAAALYAAHPDSPFFTLSDPGVLQVEGGKLN